MGALIGTERYILDHDAYDGTDTRAAVWTDYEACASWCQQHGIPPIRIRVVPAGLAHEPRGPWRFDGTHWVQIAPNTELLSGEHVSADGPTIRLLHCPTCDAQRVVDLCAVDADGRLHGHCYTCEQLVPSDEFEAVA